MRRTRGRGVVAILGATALVVSAIGVALAATLPPGGTFGDDDGSIHEANIEAIAADGITKGCNPPVNDMFCPNQSVTRAQMATFLTRALGLTPITPPPPTTSTTIPPNPGDSVNCSDFATWAEAQAWFDLYYPYYGDVAQLDSDGDLTACESLPGAPGDHPRSGDGWEWLDCTGSSGTCTYPSSKIRSEIRIESRILPSPYCLFNPFPPPTCTIEAKQWTFGFFDSAGDPTGVSGTGCDFSYNSGFLESVTCYLPLAGLDAGEYRFDLCRTEWPATSTCVETVFSAYFQLTP